MSETIAQFVLCQRCTMFSTILYNRLCPRLDQMQQEDEGGFRRSYAIELALQHCTPSDFEKRLDTLAKEKGMGIRLGENESDCLTNFRFAGDVLLFSTSLEQQQKNDV